MSLGIYPEFKPELTGTVSDALGETLASHLRILDEIAHAAKLTPITAFADNREVPNDFDGDPDELAEILGEWTEWFDPVEGQAAMRALADHIEASPKAIKRLPDAEGVVTELEEMKRVLKIAAKQGVKFRLQMG